MSVRIIASCFALSAFALALVMGLAAGNDALVTLWRALLAMALCYFVGAIVGHAARIAVNEHVQRYKRDHPLPSLDDLTDNGSVVSLSNGAPAAAENAAPQPQDAPRNAGGLPASSVA